MSACKIVGVFTTNGGHFSRYITCSQAEIAWTTSRTGIVVFDYPTWRDIPWLTMGCLAVASACIGSTIFLYIQRPKPKRDPSTTM